MVTAGFGGAIPKGLALGTVVNVVRRAGDLHASVWVKPAVRLPRIEELLCLPPQPSP